jgi:secondary thiamine-phosphate synthase enzyme
LFDVTVVSHRLAIRTRKEGELVNITDDVQKVLDGTKLNEGIAFLFVPGSTAALTTIEYEPGLTKDLPAALERLVPKNIEYEHEKSWHDGNGHSHVKASLLGPDLFVPFQQKKLQLGTWQQIVFLELDVRPRDRTIIVQLIGD